MLDFDIEIRILDYKLTKILISKLEQFSYKEKNFRQFRRIKC